jgi:hypothetical protein
MTAPIDLRYASEAKFVRRAPLSKERRAAALEQVNVYWAERLELEQLHKLELDALDAAHRMKMLELLGISS